MIAPVKILALPRLMAAVETGAFGGDWALAAAILEAAIASVNSVIRSGWM